MPSRSPKGRGLTGRSEWRHSAAGLGEPGACAPWQSARVLHGNVPAAVPWGTGRLCPAHRAGLFHLRGAPRVAEGAPGLGLLAGAASPQLRQSAEPGSLHSLCCLLLLQPWECAYGGADCLASNNPATTDSCLPTLTSLLQFPGLSLS